jgi:hypothetical protein
VGFKGEMTGVEEAHCGLRTSRRDFLSAAVTLARLSLPGPQGMLAQS